MKCLGTRWPADIFARGRRYQDFQCDPGYALLDLYDDGTFEHQYLTY